jgi:hypothetical protein
MRRLRERLGRARGPARDSDSCRAGGRGSGPESAPDLTAASESAPDLTAASESAPDLTAASESAPDLTAASESAQAASAARRRPGGFAPRPARLGSTGWGALAPPVEIETRSLSLHVQINLSHIVGGLWRDGRGGGRSRRLASREPPDTGSRLGDRRA